MILKIEKSHLWSSILLLLMLTGTLRAETTGRIFITNEKSDSVSVIDGTSLEVEATLKVGNRPRGIGLSPNGQELYVAVSEDDSIVVIDPYKLEILRTFKAGSDPETFAVHPNGNIYLSNEDDAKATVIEPATGKLLAEIRVGLEPEGVAISPRGDYVVVTSESTNMLHVIKAPENSLENNILVGARPRAATFNQAGTIAYATAEISAEVVKVDVKSAKILQQASTGDRESKPKDILLSKDESLLYIAGGRANAVIVMDAETLEIVETIPAGKRVWGLAMTRDGKRLFTTNGVSGTVSVIDTRDNEVIETVRVGQYPWGVAIHD